MQRLEWRPLSALRQPYRSGEVGVQSSARELERCMAS